MMNDVFSYIPFRTENTLQYTDGFKDLLGRKFRSYSVSIKTMGKEIHELIPNFYRDQILAPDRTRLSQPKLPQLPIVRNISAGLNSLKV